MLGKPGKTAEGVDVQGARIIAFRILAIREHSCDELIGKLQKRGVLEGIALQAVKAMESEGLVDDLRFARSLTRSRISRTQGPLKIRAELSKRGVAADLIEQALSEHDEQWSDMALDWVQRRARADLDRKEKARLYRSGTARGFSHQQMMGALNLLEKGR